jgi:serine/threonine-protein kinase
MLVLFAGLPRPAAFLNHLTWNMGEYPISLEIDETVRRRFEEAWGRGQPEPIEACLPEADESLRTATLEELVCIELEFAWRRWRESGCKAERPPPLENYLEQFPGLAAPEITARLARQEFLVRREAGSEVSQEEYRERFPHARRFLGWDAAETIRQTVRIAADEPPPVVGAVSSRESEIRALLQRRLKAIAPVGVFAWSSLLAASLAGAADLGRAQIGGVTQALLAANALYLAGVAVMMQRKLPWGFSVLRTLEIGQYALLCSLIAAMRIVAMHRRLTSDFPTVGTYPALNVVMAMTAFGFLIGITMAGVVFPNTRRRAAAIVLSITAIPLTIDATLAVAHPERLSQIGGGAIFSGMILLYAVTLALFASAKIEALQREASAARREAREARALGPYVLKRRLGSGGMGEVYEAEHRLLKRPCAVKLIRPERAGDSQMLARFDREVQATARLKHPNTVDVFDYGRTDDGVFYYVMEYLEGLSLEQLVDRHGPLPSSRAVHVLIQACGALREAHEAGLVHRDIKPSNLFLCRYGGMFDMVKLLDFGLVQNTLAAGDSRLTLADGFVGTPGYMSPEQAEGASPDARSDLYSLGATAFFLLTGQPPFEGETMLDVLFAHRHQSPPALADFGVEAPPELESIIRRCLAKSPQDRFPDAASLAQALRETTEAWSDEQAREWWDAEALHPAPVATSLNE